MANETVSQISTASPAHRNHMHPISEIMRHREQKLTEVVVKKHTVWLEVNTACLFQKVQTSPRTVIGSLAVCDVVHTGIADISESVPIRTSDAD